MLFKRDDELATFVHIETRKPVIWVAGQNEGCIWHATADNKRAVCSFDIMIDLEANPYPSIVDRSNDLMTCLRCQDKVTKLKK